MAKLPMSVSVDLARKHEMRLGLVIGILSLSYMFFHSVGHTPHFHKFDYYGKRM